MLHTTELSHNLSLMQIEQKHLLMCEDFQRMDQENGERQNPKMILELAAAQVKQEHDASIEHDTSFNELDHLMLKDFPWVDQEKGERQDQMMLEPAAAQVQQEHDTPGRLANLPISALASPDLSFPWRLFIMLEQSTAKGLDNIVSWIDNGTAFKVYDQQAFEKTILPQYFIKMTKYNSFTRQLYAYNFTWIRNGISKGGCESI